ncbi:MAG: hypothetical protein PHU85_19380 [Phycisphaerae bacterium]|nr:hypothetical protein [Phycisphaerae bacterium]
MTGPLNRSDFLSLLWWTWGVGVGLGLGTLAGFGVDFFAMLAWVGSIEQWRSGPQWQHGGGYFLSVFMFICGTVFLLFGMLCPVLVIGAVCERARSRVVVLPRRAFSLPLTILTAMLSILILMWLNNWAIRFYLSFYESKEIVVEGWDADSPPGSPWPLLLLKKVFDWTWAGWVYASIVWFLAWLSTNPLCLPDGKRS